MIKTFSPALIFINFLLHRHLVVDIDKNMHVEKNAERVK